MFLLILVFAGVFTVFFSSAFFLYRSYFARGSSFFSYSAKMVGFHEGMPDIEMTNSAIELSIIGSDGVKLKGDYFAKNANGFDNADESEKLVVIVPGYGDSVKSVYAPAAEYIKRGFDVVIVYPRGIGKSGGKYCGLSCVDSKDLVRWLKYLSKRLDIVQTGTQAKKQIILHGFSFGASAVIQCVSSREFYKAKLNEYVLKAIADSAFTSLRDVFSDYYNHFTQKSRFQRFFFMQVLNYMSLVSFLSGKNFFCNISPFKFLKRRERLFAKSKKNNSDTASQCTFKRSRRKVLKILHPVLAAKFKHRQSTVYSSEQTDCSAECIKSPALIKRTPIIFIHGKKDTICRFEMSEKLFVSSGAAEKGNHIVLFDEATHGGSFYINPEKYMETILSF